MSLQNLVESFSTRGYSKWKDTNEFYEHVWNHSSLHNTSKATSEALMNKRQNVGIVLAKNSVQSKVDSHTQLFVCVDCIHCMTRTIFSLI